MKILKNLNGTNLPFAQHVWLLLGMSALTRLVLLLRTGSDSIPFGLWPELLIRGAWFDILVACWLVAVGFAWATITPSRWRETRWQNPIRLVLFSLNAMLLVFIAFAEFTFWDEFSTRVNFIAVG